MADLQDHIFRIAVPGDVLDDLRQRLEHTRWPAAAIAPPWRYGTELPYLREVVAHWLHRYDWPAWETRLNRWPQYRVPVEGTRLHVIIEPGSGENPPPLVLLNGWPSSIVEFLEVIEPLAHPERFGGDAADAFTVIVPSLPGYGFSDPPPAPVSVREAARLVGLLLREQLGYERFLIHGGDWGAAVGGWMCVDAPSEVVALHVNNTVLRQATTAPPLDEQEVAYLALRAKVQSAEVGYQAIQGTKPQTLSYGLTDSPVGLAAWILEKFKGWVNPATDAPPPFDMDVMLTNVMVYWLNGINASLWLYCDLFEGGAATLPPGRRVETPTGLFVGDQDLSPPPPDQWIARTYNLAHRRDAPGMGHFPFLEVPAQQVDDLRAFFRAFREDFA